MKFLERDLESIIYTNYSKLVHRGLDIDQTFYEGGLKFRQMRLGVFGIADLVYINYSPIQDKWHVQVIECKRGPVNGETYLQAKRYARAVEDILLFSPETRRSTRIATSVVLIGEKVDCKGQISHAISLDTSCTTFTYKYLFDGIAFRDCSIYWSIEEADEEIVEKEAATVAQLNAFVSLARKRFLELEPAAFAPFTTANQ